MYGCSSFHTNKRNKLAQQRMNDLVFVKYNQALKALYDKINVPTISLDNIIQSNQRIVGKIGTEPYIDEMLKMILCLVMTED